MIFWSPHLNFHNFIKSTYQQNFLAPLWKNAFYLMPILPLRNTPHYVKMLLNSNSKTRFFNINPLFVYRNGRCITFNVKKIVKKLGCALYAGHKNIIEFQSIFSQKSMLEHCRLRIENCFNIGLIRSALYTPDTSKMSKNALKFQLCVIADHYGKPILIYIKKIEVSQIWGIKPDLPANCFTNLVS